MKEFDFTVERNGHCKVYRNSQRGKIIAICSCVFDAMIVVHALEQAEPKQETVYLDEARDRIRDEAFNEYEDTLFDPT